MKFTKMHGAGNDYIYIYGFVPENPGALAAKLSDRHFGVGSDGLVLILPSEIADFKMRMFNADGTEAEMCGNAIRCVGKYVYDNAHTNKTKLVIETLAGLKYLDLTVSGGEVSLVRVDMGAPEFSPALIPVDLEGERVINRAFVFGGREYKINCVSMGNPHCVIFVPDTDAVALHEVGPVIENHEIFPNRVNVGFAQIIDRGTIKLRVWERGAGETLACGTGACAAMAAAVQNDLVDQEATILVKGGSLKISWKGPGKPALMTGGAVKVFEGEI